MKRRGRHRKIHLRLERLCVDGHWGGLRPGISRQALVQRLGVPPRWERSMAELRAMQQNIPIAGWAFSEVLAYGGVEFHFPENPHGGCVRIFSDDLDALPTSEPVRVDPWGLSEGMPLPAVEKHLTDNGMSFVNRPFPPAPTQIRLVLPSGVRLGLTCDSSFFDAPIEDSTVHRLFCVELARSHSS